MLHTLRLKRLLIILSILISIFFLASKTQAKELFGPKIVDVTTKAFSVVWTTDSDYSTCGIKFYTDSNYNILKSMNPQTIIIETNEGHLGKKNHIAKVSVVGLAVGETYYFKPTQNGTELSGKEVTTERLRGFDLNDPNISDIVSNPIVHKAIYQSNGTSPAIGALVLADIYAHDADPDTDPPLSDYPISAWVGQWMPGDENATEYDPNNISYKQYAPLNMNNLYGRDSFPLSLHGDDPATKTINEGEIIRFTIVHGEQDVLGQESGRHWFTKYGYIGATDEVNGEKITTAKISAGFRFKKGVNVFAFPCKILPGYTTGDLLEDIESAEGKEDIVESIYVFEEDVWLKTYKTFHPIIGPKIENIYPLPYGKGAFVIMNQDMTKEVVFYGNPETVRLDLFSDRLNIVPLPPQMPLFYETGHFLNDIESAGAGENSVENIWFYNDGWKRTYKIDHPLMGPRIQNSAPMSNIKFYMVVFKDNANDVLNFDPFSFRQRRRLKASNLTFFY